MVRRLLPKWCGLHEVRASNKHFYSFAANIVDAELESYLSGDQTERSNYIHVYADQMKIAKENLVENPAYHRKF